MKELPVPKQINFMVGGEAGQGVQSVGFLIAKIFARAGYHVFADQDYESRVRGGHNFFRIRVSEFPVETFSDNLDILIALNRESVELHHRKLTGNGTLICDSSITYSTGVRTFSLPLEEIALEVTGSKLTANTVALGSALGLIRAGIIDTADAVIRGYFSGEMGEKNAGALRAGFEQARRYTGAEQHLEANAPERTSRILLNGNEAIALGALAAGCRFMAAYPMTPVTPIMEYLASKSKETGVVVFQPEDEIAAINAVVGASFAGARAMTATSGGGFCLMVEGLSLAGMTETPVVVVLGQRPGPAIGLPTRTEQGELWFAIHAGHGEFPRAVLTPGNADEAFWSIIHAFNLAERYQTPVIVMTDHVLATSYFTVREFDLSKVVIDRGELFSSTVRSNIVAYQRHKVTDSGVSPRAFPMQSPDILVCTDSDEHDESGHLIEDAATRITMVRKRMRKFKGLKNEILQPVRYGPETPETLLIGWGSTRGALRESVDNMTKNGISISTLHLKQVWPFPSDIVADAISKSRKVFTVENNATGQLARLIRAETGLEISNQILRYDGRPFSPSDIISAVAKGGQL